MYFMEGSEHYNYDTDITIVDIKTYFQHHNNSGTFFSMFETGLDNLRFDMIRVDPYRQYIRIFEFKSCRKDFVSDGKWEKYLPYCHTLTFVCPRNVINRTDLPRGIGLLWVYKWQHKNNPINSQWRLEGEWRGRPRKTEVEQAILTRLAFMLIYRTIWRKEAVF